MNKNIVIVMMLSCLLAACATPYSNGRPNYGEIIPGSDDYSNQQTNEQAVLGDFYQDPTYGVNVVGGPSSQAKDRIIYFAFDSTKLDQRSVSVISEQAKYLIKNPSVRIVLEGHTDEKGSREYNIGLGERRAYAVKRLFEEEGVATQQIRVLSYGEERPASYCSDESCYAKNRRVVIVY